MCSPTRICTKCGREYDPELPHTCSQSPSEKPGTSEVLVIPEEFKDLEEFKAYVRKVGSNTC